MTSETEQMPGKLKTGCWLRVLASIVIIIAVIVALFPSILSMSAVRRLVENRINISTGGKLQMESWSFSWFSGTAINGLKFSNDQGLGVTVDRITTSRGLSSMIGRCMDIGTLIVNSPEITIAEPQKKYAAKNEQIAPSGVGEEPTSGEVKPVKPVPGAKTESPQKPLRLPVDFSGTIKVTGGKMSVTEAGGRKHEFEKINCVIGISRLNKPATIEAGFLQVGGGAFSAGGSLKIIENGILDTSKLYGSLTAEIAALDLEPLSLMVDGLGNLPMIKGMADARVAVKLDGISKVSAEGSIRLSNVIMSGGPLGSDKPKFDSAKLSFSILADDRNFSVRSFNLESPFLSATAGGELVDKGSKYPAGNIVLNATLDVPRLAAELPATLRLGKDTRIVKGNVSVKAEVQSGGDALSCAIGIRLVDLAATAGGRNVELGQPIELDGNVVATGDDFQIEKCLLASSFANISARGNLKDMQVTVNAEIGPAMEEIRKFIDTGRISASGKISSVTLIKSVSDRERKLTSRINVDNLKVTGFAPSPLAINSTVAALNGTLDADARGEIAGVSGLKLSVTTDPFSAKAEVARIIMGDKPERNEVRGLSVNAHGDLGKLFAVCRGMGLLKAGNDGAGRAEVAFTGEMKNGFMSLNPVSLDVVNLVLAADNKKFVDPSISAKCSIEFDTIRHGLKVAGLDVKTSAGTANVPSLVVAGWPGKMPEVSTAGTVNLNVGKLFSSAADFLAMPKGSSVSGNLDGKFAVSSAGESQAVNLDVVLNNLNIKPVSGPVVTESAIKLRLDSRQDQVSGDITVKNLNFDSSILALTATGSLTGLDKDKTLTLAGTQAVDFKRIGELVTAFGGKPVEMEGKRSKQFRIKTSLAEPDWKKMLAVTDADIGLYLGRLRAFGMEVEGVEFSTLAAMGVIKSSIVTKVNDGDLQIKPEVNAVVKDAFLSVADDSMVLRNVRITDGMVSDLLGRVHPVLRGCLATSGQTDLVLKKCHVPLDAKQKDRIVVEGAFVLKNVVLQPSGLLKDLLGLARLEIKPVSLADKSIAFACRDGRITSDPLNIGNNDYSLTLAGYVTLDGMMKYTVMIPVTEKMVGKDVFKYVSNVTIKVPVEGPVDKPVISADVIKKTLSDLVKSAAKEAATKALIEDGGKLLEDLFKKRAKPGSDVKK